MNNIEFQISDAMLAPGVSTGQRLNADRVWVRYDGGPWVTTSFKSIAKARRFVDTFASESRAFKALTEEEE